MKRFIGKQSVTAAAHNDEFVAFMVQFRAKRALIVRAARARGERDEAIAASLGISRQALVKSVGADDPKARL